MATIALKEWAVAVKALRDGRQTLLVRKGGIREETRQFRVQADEFLFFPTFEHQNVEQLQPAFLPDLEEVLAARGDPDTVTIDTFARLTDVFEVTEPWQVEALAPHYCWTVRYAEERLRWRPRQPLLVMAVRAYRLANPIVLDLLPEHGGCKSWLSLSDDVSLADMTPSLCAADYTARLTAIRAVLSREPSTLAT
jgi:hypothetical protein